MNVGVNAKSERPTRRDRQSTVIIKYLSLVTTRPKKFLQSIEKLCKEHAGEAYNFKYDVED